MANKEKVNPAQCEVMAKLVDDLTTTGKPILDEKQMKAFKKICKQSDAYVKHAYHLLITQLEKKHSEVRLSCLLMIDELFQRSHCFREELLGDFQFFLMLVAETETDVPLPPPKAAAKTLKSKSLETVQRWHEQFSGVHKKLALGYNYLQHCKKVDFNDIRARNMAERRREEEESRKREQQQKERIETASKELFEGKLEIESVVTQLENCLQLLLPEVDSFSLHGLASPEYRPHYNPFRIPSRRPSATQAAPTASENSSGLDFTEPSACSPTKPRKTRRSSTKSVQSDPEELNRKSNMQLNRTDKANEYQVMKESTCSKPGSLAKHDSCSSDRAHQATNSDRALSHHDCESEDDLEEMSGDEDDTLPLSQFVRESGLGSNKYSLSIDVNPVTEITETPDNIDIIRSMKDLNRELTKKWLPAVGKWLEVLTKNGAVKENILKAIDLKRLITKVAEKINKIRILRAPRIAFEGPSMSMESKADSDSDFEDVPEKEGFEPRIADHLREEYGLVSKPPKPSTSKDWKLEDTTAEYNHASEPTSWQATLKKLEEKILSETKDSPGAKVSDGVEPSTSGVPAKKPRNPNVPILPFGTDLLHWGEENVEVPLIVRYESDLKGWVPKGDEEDVVDVNALESMKTRVMNFEGKFVPVKWKCRAVMPNGKLCPRMDRVKCPFHGKVIARDEEGRPTDPQDIARLAQQEAHRQEAGAADWEDRELQADIEAQTGKQLLRKGKRKSKGKEKDKKYPGLTDVRKPRDTCRKRLEKKVLSSGAVKRVAAAMDRVQERKIQDKFGNNFAYAVPRRVPQFQ